MTIRSIIAQYASPFAARVGVISSNIFATLALAWAFEPEIFGKIVFIWNFVLIYSAFISLGIPNYLLRELSFRLDEDHALGKLSLATTGAFIFLIPALLTGGSAALLLWLFEEQPALLPKAVESAAIIPVTFLMSYLVNLTSALSSSFILADRINVTMFARDGLPSVTLVAAIFMPDLADSPMLSLFWNFVVLQAAIVSAGIIALILFGNLLKSAFETRIGSMPNILGFWGLASINVLVTGIDVLIGGWILGTRDLGHYQIIKRICNLVALPQVVVTWAIAIPLGRAFARGNRSEMVDAIREGAKLSLYPLLPLLVGGAVVATASSAYFGYGLDPGSLALVTINLATSLAVVIFGPSMVVATQTRLEIQALGSRIAGVVLFAFCATLASFHNPGPGALALCQLASVFCSGFVLWEAIFRKFAIDSSVFILLRRQSN